jgi:hypothetical protein
MSKMLTIGLSLGLLLAAAPAALAQNASPPAAAAPAPSSPAPAIMEPKAVELLKTMSATLAAAQTISFKAVSTYERAATNGQPLFYSSLSEVAMQRPDKLRVITLGDGTPDEFYYDGKLMMAYVPSAELVAVTEAPPTLDKLLDQAWDKAAIYFPFADALESDPYADLAKHITSAFYIGQSIAVGGVKTDMIAVAGEDAAAQIWIGADDHLPRKVAVVYAHEPAQALYQIDYSNWKLGETIEASAFASEKAAKAKHIEFSPPGAPKPPAPKPPAPKPPAPTAPADGK